MMRDPASGCVTKGDEVRVLERRLQFHVRRGTIHNSRDVETPCESADRCRGKANGRYVNTYARSGCCFAVKNDPAVCDNMDDLEDTVLS